jgi:two-component system cell cycle sensor histidine kinase/response regulator CckA
VNVLSRPAWYRYALAALVVAAVHCLRLALVAIGALLPETPFVVLYFLPVIISGWVFGFGPGLFAGLLGVAIGDSVSLGAGSEAPIGARVVRVGTFLAETVLLSWLLWSRRHGETQRAEMQRRYRVLTSNFPNGAVMLFDRDLRYLLADGAGLATIGLSPATMEGRATREVFPAEVCAIVEPQYRAALEGREVVGEVEYRGRTLLSRVVPVRDEGGAVECGLAMTQDVTDRHHLEQQLRQAQKMDALGRLAGGVAHDFNNLLAVILGRCERLHGRVGDPALAQEIASIRQAGERAAALTRQMLAFSRKRLVEPRPLDLSALIADLEQMLSRLMTERIHLLVRLERPLPRVLADPGQIEQVLMNLCINARDAINDRGQIVIETSVAELDAEACRNHPGLAPGPHVRLEVRDTGSGMDAAVRARLYEPFFTTKPAGKGTGLGLSIVFGIVTHCRGHIACLSAPGSGTVFTILLPAVADAAPEALEAPAPAPAAAARGETVLLVEDEQGVREMVRDALVSSGYRLLVAEHAEAALALASRHPGPIHVLVSDMVMPGMNGAQLNLELRKARPKLKTVLLSGYTEDESVVGDRLGPHTVFLQKPFPLAALDTSIRALLDGSRISAAIPRPPG